MDSKVDIDNAGRTHEPIRVMHPELPEGDSWVRINDEQHQWGLLLHITGDPKEYGRVYVGTHGRGIVYGDPLRPHS